MNKTIYKIVAIIVIIITVILGVVLWINIKNDQINITVLDNGDIEAVSENGSGIKVSFLEKINKDNIHIIKLNDVLEDVKGDISMFDFIIEDRTSFSTVLEITIPYNSSYFDKGESASDCLTAFYYNEKSKELEPVIFEIDEEKEQVTIYSDHLSEYGIITYKNGDERKKEFPNLTYPSKIDEIISENGIESYAKAVESFVKDDMDNVNLYAMDVALKDTSLRLGGFSSELGVLGEIKSTNPYLKVINDGLTNVGLVYIAAQVAVDYMKDDPMMAANFTKNILNWSVAVANPVAGALAFTYDYTLTKIGDVIAKFQEETKEDYYSFYDLYEKEQKLTVYMRMFNDFYKIYKDNRDSTDNPEQIIRQKIKDKVWEYCYLPWTPDVVENYDSDVLYLEQDNLIKKITTDHYNEMVNNTLQPVFAALKKRISYDSKMAALNAKKELDKELDTWCKLKVSEINNIENSDYKYKNYIIKFDVSDEYSDDWTFVLDEKGSLKKDFTVRDYIMAGFPEKAFIYKNKIDENIGNVLKEITFQFDGEGHSINISLGSEEEFTLETSITEITAGESVIFSLNPFGSDYTCKWSVNNKVIEDSGSYIKTYFSETGINKVEVEVYKKIDENNTEKVAYITRDILVEPVDLTLEADYSEKDNNNGIDLFVLSENSSPSTMYFEWDFGNGDKDEGYYNEYNYSYTVDGDYKVVIKAYRVTDTGEKIFVGSASKDININGETSLETQLYNEDESLTDDMGIVSGEKKYGFVLYKTETKSYTSDTAIFTINMTETTMKIHEEYKGSTSSTYDTLFAWPVFSNKLICGETYKFTATASMTCVSSDPNNGKGMTFNGWVGEWNGSNQNYIKMISTSGSKAYNYLVVDIKTCPSGEGIYELSIPNKGTLEIGTEFTIKMEYPLSMGGAWTYYRYRLEEIN